MLVLRAVARVEISLFQAAGLSASGGGPITTPSPHEGSGSELVIYWFGAPASDAPLKYKFAIGIQFASLRSSDDRSSRCGITRAVHYDTLLSEMLDAARSDPYAESPAYVRQAGRPARRNR